mmetsp:Transcript_32771/g.105881  ORF Transcript_32771/g.105881 Transcript_32771/m.105881 type:complete len:227 (-) Transcript_32771:195-875(-)
MCRDDHDLPHFSLYARSPSPSRSRLRRCEKIKIGRVGALMKRRSCCNGSVYAVVRMLPSTLLSPMRRNVKKWAYSPLTCRGTPVREEEKVTCRTYSDSRNMSGDGASHSRALAKISMRSAFNVRPGTKISDSRFGLTPKGLGSIGSALYSTRSMASYPRPPAIADRRLVARSSRTAPPFSRTQRIWNCTPSLPTSGMRATEHFCSPGTVGSAKISSRLRRSLAGSS